MSKFAPLKPRAEVAAYEQLLYKPVTDEQAPTQNKRTGNKAVSNAVKEYYDQGRRKPSRCRCIWLGERIDKTNDKLEVVLGWQCPQSKSTQECVTKPEFCNPHHRRSETDQGKQFELFQESSNEWRSKSPRCGSGTSNHKVVFTLPQWLWSSCKGKRISVASIFQGFSDSDDFLLNELLALIIGCKR